VIPFLVQNLWVDTGVDPYNAGAEIDPYNSGSTPTMGEASSVSRARLPRVWRVDLPSS
jgi:hypothetical protein